MTYAHGSRHHASKLREPLVREMRLDFADGLTYRELAKKYGVSRQCAWMAVNYVTWRHVK